MKKQSSRIEVQEESKESENSRIAPYKDIISKLDIMISALTPLQSKGLSDLQSNADVLFQPPSAEGDSKLSDYQRGAIDLYSFFREPLRSGKLAKLN